MINIIGQHLLKRNLDILISNVKNNKSELGHILLMGPGGMGKTTIAKYISEQSGIPMHSYISHKFTLKELELFCKNIQGNKVILFLDEIHSLSQEVEECLYPIFDSKTYFVSEKWSDGTYSVTYNKNIQLPFVYIIGATTNQGSLTKPLYSRFTYTYFLEPYSVTDLVNLGEKYIVHLDGVDIKSILEELASKARSNARYMVQLVLQTNNYIKAGITNIKEILELLGIDSLGLTKRDKTYLSYLIFGPKSLDTLSQLLREPKDTIINYIEPYLLELNLIEISSKGRNLTEQGKKLF